MRLLRRSVVPVVPVVEPTGKIRIPKTPNQRNGLGARWITPRIPSWEA